jgi:ATP sulfurylase
MDVEQIAIGTFSPITGFMNKDEIDSVLQDYKLLNNVVWPLPIFLQINEENFNSLEIGNCVTLLLNNTNEAYATLLIDNLFKYDLNILSDKIFGTNDTNHPGVKGLMAKGNFFVGGKVQLIKRIPSKYKYYEFTPVETRTIFKNKGWNRVVGFHTRNIPHRVHEYIQLEALEKYNCDGLFIHPIVGQKKKGDFQQEVIIKTYDTLIKKYYPKGKSLLGAFQNYSRYAGPREAVFTALCRKNFGCTHFIMGRDHTGVDNYYTSNDSHKLLDRLGNIGIDLVLFDNIKYSSIKKRYVNEHELNDNNNEPFLSISGSEARRMFEEERKPPDWFMRQEVSNIILDNIKRGKRVFVD